jgi:hypothetical protein
MRSARPEQRATRPAQWYNTLMTKPTGHRRHESAQMSEPLAIAPRFLLLFSTTLRSRTAALGDLPSGLAPLPADAAKAYLDTLSDFEARLLGRRFRESRRITRQPVGRIALDGLPAGAPPHADVCLLQHKAGVALWEVWLVAPVQPLDASYWIARLDAEAQDGVVARVWRALAPLSERIAGAPRWSGLYFPLIVLRSTRYALAEIVERHGADLVRLLFLDRSDRPLKPDLVVEELARDYCGRVGGMSLLARHCGLDVHGREEPTEGSAPEALPPRSALPFLITLEVLLLERTVLQQLYERLSRQVPRTVDDLLALKQEVLDGLEEYYGALTTATRFSDAVTTDGERLFGIADLYDAVMDRLDAISFAITTRYQKRMTLLQVWLTVVFGATEIGFIASGIATWYYAKDLFAVLAWTIGASVVSGALLVGLLYGKLRD